MNVNGKNRAILGLSAGFTYASVLNSLPFYVFLVDETHRILFANDATLNTLKLSPADIIGGYCPKVVHGLDHAFPGCPLEEAVETGTATSRELFDDRIRRWFDSAIYPTGGLTPDGKRIYLHMVRDITAEKTSAVTLERHRELTEVSTSLLSLSMRDATLTEILEHLLYHILSIDWLVLERRGAVFLVEDELDVLVMKAQSNLAQPIKEACAQVPFGRCICGRAAKTRQTQFVDCVNDCHETRYQGMTPHGHYCVPIISEDELLGVITVYVKEGHKRDLIEEEFLTAIASTAAGIIVRRRSEEDLKKSYEKLQKSLNGTIDAITLITEKRDPYTAGHQRRVSEIALVIAREMGLSKDRVELLQIAASLHDIGKIYVPAEILSKPGKVNEMELNIIKTHSQVGYDILKTAELPYLVAEIVLEHHEKMNGSGYPQGLKGSDILLEARIICVADVVEAMTSHRPYRPALGKEKALEEIYQNKGILYDPDAVDACLKLFAENKLSFNNYTI